MHPFPFPRRTDRRTDRRTAAVGWHVGWTSTGWEASAALRIGRDVCVAGWGADMESPVRPWPTWNAGAYRGCRRLFVAWLGFFVAGFVLPRGRR